MNILVTNNSGHTINPVFEPTPRNLVEVKQFYVDLFNKGEIDSFLITYDNGETFGMTAGV